MSYHKMNTSFGAMEGFNPFALVMNPWTVGGGLVGYFAGKKLGVPSILGIAAGMYGGSKALGMAQAQKRVADMAANAPMVAQAQAALAQSAAAAQSVSMLQQSAKDAAAKGQINGLGVVF